MKWKRWILIVLAIFLLAAIFTNPTKQDYIQFTEESMGEPIPEDADNTYIERINFVLFSAYSPVTHHEHGMTHLGIFGQFVQISDGQYDYPIWLEFFN